MWAILWVLVLFSQAPDFNAQGLKALDQRQYQTAVQAFTRAIEADPDNYAAHFNLALAYGFLHRDSEGIQEYRKTLALKPGLYPAELNSAILLLREKKPADALPLLQDAVRQKPKEFRPRRYLADAQLQCADAPAAESNYRLALEIDPKSAPAELGLGRALATEGNLTDAAPHFRRAADLDPDYRDALLELADLYEKQHRLPDALAIYSQFPDNAAVQEHVGELMLENKQYTAAIPRLEMAYQKDPTQANRLALALSYVSAGQFDKAIPLFEKAVAADPDNYEVRMMLGRALRDARQYPGAAREFSEALKLKPEEAKTWSDLAGMLYMIGDYQQALAAFERARELGEDAPGNWFFRAIILDRLKQVKPALEAYQRFLSMSQGKNPDQEFQARQRARILTRELENR